MFKESLFILLHDYVDIIGFMKHQNIVMSVKLGKNKETNIYLATKEQYYAWSKERRNTE